MDRVIQSGPARSGLFFGAAVLISTFLGALGGDILAGLRSGVLIGLAFAVFAYVFIQPASEDERSAND